jgi:hypothetical protein
MISISNIILKTIKRIERDIINKTKASAKLEKNFQQNSSVLAWLES